MKIDAYLTEHARKTPSRIFLEEGNNSISYGALEASVNDIASSMREYRHCRFAILEEMGIQYIKMLMAVYRSDNIAIPMPIEMPPSSLEKILDAGHVRNIITTETQYSKFGEAFFERFGTVIIISDDNSCKFLRKELSVESNHPKLRLVLYTSGTTGIPKGVMLSDKNITTNAAAIIKILNLTSADKAAQVISPHHAFGNSIINSHLMSGGCISMGNMKFIGSVFGLIESDVTVFYGVPSTYRILLRYPDRFKKAFSNVKVAASAGGGMTKQIVRNIKELAPGIEILPMYGQTEATARLAYVPKQDVEEFIETIGMPIPGVTLDVFDDNRNPVEPNITGELVAKGDNILLGYLDDENATKKKIVDGWMYTGDLAQKLPNGYFKLMGRKDDLLKIGDHLVNPREIEKSIENNNKVSAVFVVPVPHDLMGTAICLMVIPEPETDIDVLFKFCRKNLPSHLHPKEILFIDHLPLTENGKICNRLILEEYKNVKNCM
ncbi:class I adenylate-forming enzyme family protein [uncultured Methanomethylovorans sp.]|uniref:class I adenylate-forming enzyme family protein n=1 Tax=uncultured Methanomethylovorans sp. TaxID=183759 RepID=UPI002AA89964|nr:class I adenylate-forming enzyme family protein [uncultured Methanomethylovorans sp.]